MKKLIVLLLAVVMVGAAFAQTPTVSASSTLSWGWDLDSGQTGFQNANDITIEVPFTLEDAEKKGDKGWWGEIAISNLTFILSDDAFSANDPLTFTDVDGDIYHPRFLTGSKNAAGILINVWSPPHF